jgi:DNA-binding response OmpR family regulator
MQSAQILIIDDQIESIALLLKYFQGQDIEVMVAIDGKDGLRKALDGEPDIILLDVSMPHLSGFEVCRHLKADARTAQIPVIFLSANNTLQHKLEGFSVGGVDYIGKPFSSEEVLARVYVQLNHRRDLLQVQSPREAPPVDEILTELNRDNILINLALAELRDNSHEWSGMEALARAVGSNEKKITELFRRQFGLTVYEYLVTLRLEEARSKLARSDLQIQAIAEEAGYRNASDFSRAFRLRYSLGPRQYRQSIESETPEQMS